jgi:hypothetical protein
VGIALMLDQGELADAPIGLTQLHADLLGQPHQPLARPIEKLGDNGLVAGSSPPGPTTQSCANPEFRRPILDADHVV